MAKATGGESIDPSVSMCDTHVAKKPETTSTAGPPLYSELDLAQLTIEAKPLGSVIFLPDRCDPPPASQRKERIALAPVRTPPPPSRPASSKGFTQKQSTYRISAAPSGRGRCRRCRAVIGKGDTRLEISAFVKPGRYTLLLRCTAPSCIDARLSAAILSVYKHTERVPVDAALEGSAEAHRVVDAINCAGPDAQ